MNTDKKKHQFSKDGKLVQRLKNGSSTNVYRKPSSSIPHKISKFVRLMNNNFVVLFGPKNGPVMCCIQNYLCTLSGRNTYNTEFHPLSLGIKVKSFKSLTRLNFIRETPADYSDFESKKFSIFWFNILFTLNVLSTTPFGVHSSSRRAKKQSAPSRQGLLWFFRPSSVKHVNGRT